MTSATLLTGTTALPGVTTPPSTTSYLDGWTSALLLTGFLAMGVCVVSGLRGHGPGRVTLGVTGLLQLVVTAVFGVYLARTIGGEHPVGPPWELWAYLVTVLMVPAVAWLWTRSDSSRWGTFVLALAGFVVAVMGARAAQIWHGVGFS
ncbi:hypothetical protein MWU75_14150 [Ornithinimicrobium sp. F0845]|uniref:hypothetical protein n=1 Tax=Ornithinimicrobium sp. F0845 TaxID=2926412 RepID=UPI001FF0ECBC|nr:hypothetical protein [Ornithinimicrobium sp. F0845]MCK0113287.1 hypothetical protein [Ornithinimicrobium sp. F0845]